MLYIKIGKKNYAIRRFETFNTQIGNDAIRIVGEDIPVAPNGFLIVDENENVITDRSDYIYLYREDEDCKEYTSVEETIVPTECHAMGDIPLSPIVQQIALLSSKVNQITPYMATKYVYIDDTECIFDKVKDGNISAWLIIDNEQVPCDFYVDGDKIIVVFEPLENVGTCNIFIQ